MPYEPTFELGWNLHSGLCQEIRRYEEWLLFSDITIKGEYKAAIDYCLTIPVGKPITFLDLGANVGFASYYFIDRLIRMGHSFKGLLIEGNPETFQELSRRLKDHTKVIGSNIIVPLCGLVGKRAGKDTLRIDGAHTLSTVSKNQPDKGVYIESTYIDLEDYLDDFETPIDFIKCDIEEAEFAFVENYPELLKRTNIVIMEIHHKSGEEIVKTMYKRLAEAGLKNWAKLKVNGNVSTELFSRIPLAPIIGPSS